MTQIYLKWFIFLLICINIFLASTWIQHKNILFHTDIARDFLLIEDIVTNHNISLLGPRTGGIPGVFHGPLWLYLNLPAFFLGSGSPFVIGWFWILLYIVTIIITYSVGKRLADEKTGLLSALLVSANLIYTPRNFLNPFGALMISPVLFYFFSRYITTKSATYLALCLFTAGLVIQFQMAFGVPLLLLIMLYACYVIYKEKKFLHILTFTIPTIPLASFIVFDIRHQFLQSHAIIKYIHVTDASAGAQTLNISTAISRLDDIVKGIGMAVTQNNLFILFFVCALLFSMYRIYKRKDLTGSNVYVLFLYFYLGFWTIALFFKGHIWDYYFSPFIPLIIIIFASLHRYINKYIFYPIFFVIFSLYFIPGAYDFFSYNEEITHNDISTWRFNATVSQDVFADAPGDFGYYIFTSDLYGYSFRYAMNYTQREYKNKKAYPYQKMKVTYLLISPSSNKAGGANAETWKKYDIKIDKAPNKEIKYPNGTIVQKYILSDEDIKVSSNPDLIQSIIFR